LERLTVELRHICDVLLSIPMDALATLKELKLQKEPPPLDRLHQPGFTSRLSALLSHHIHNLEILDVPYLVHDISVEAISKNRNLRELQLHDFSEFEGKGIKPMRHFEFSNTFENNRLSVLTSDKLFLIQNSCPLITYLDLPFGREQDEVRRSRFVCR